MAGSGSTEKRTTNTKKSIKKTAAKDSDGLASPRYKNRISIENVTPAIDGGAFPARVVAGESVTVEADVFSDGHDKIAVAIQHRPSGTEAWSETRMVFLSNDRWRAKISFDQNGAHEMRVVAWQDLFADWADGIAKKQSAGVPIQLELQEGAELLEATAVKSEHLNKADKAFLGKAAKALKTKDEGKAFAAAVDGDLANVMRRSAIRTNLSISDVLPVWADRKRAEFSAWYELFPRSMSGKEDVHGTFDDVIAKLPYVQDLGFDVLYFPPIHPIGKTNRKGRNNTLKAAPDDVGVPYAIGSEDGGHTAIHSELGTMADFSRLVKAASEHGLEIALDIALNASPDHPWIKEHPEWFEWRPDGTIKFAENPPKKYEDIVNFDYYNDDYPELWRAMRDMFLFWVNAGVKIFRVDNPHTKPFPFWHWLIDQVQAKHPDTIFLAEAFTKPKVMKRLAKIGFNQSYSYFTWRNEKWELEQYLNELTGQLPGWEDMPDVYRPNFFVNTPDINPEYLQTGGRPAHRARLALAATLGANYGVYNGFEVCDARAIPGKEEYLNSEKYQIRAWDMEKPNYKGEEPITDDIRLMNRVRAEHPALQQFRGLKFYNAWNEHIIYYGKMTPDLSSFILCAVNLDPFHDQGAGIEVPLWEFGLPNHAGIDGTDLVTGQDFRWEGKDQSVFLTPHDRPYAIWQLHKPNHGHNQKTDITSPAKSASAQSK
jgi:starch synthase (maltosyl-transferring)